MVLEDILVKLNIRHNEERLNIEKEIEKIEKEYTKLKYNTEKLKEKKKELLEIIDKIYWLHFNIINNKPSPEEFSNIASEMEALVNKKKNIIYKLNYPMIKIDEYNRKKVA